ncbi:MAG: PilZ domain-containing protein [Nannocystaceae bacterium]
MSTAPSAHDRRLRPRFHAAFRVYALQQKDAQWASVEVVDLSASGMHIRCDDPRRLVDADGNVSLRLALAHDSPKKEISLHGTAIRVEARELALRFDQAEIGDAAFMTSLLCDGQIPHSKRIPNAAHEHQGDSGRPQAAGDERRAVGAGPAKPEPSDPH